MKKYAISSTQITLLCLLSLLYTHNVRAQTTSYPYIEDFESGPAGWTVEGTTTSWELGIPSGDQINSAASGENAWVTNPYGIYLNNEDGWVQSPVFDLSSLDTPFVQFNISRVCVNGDGAVLQASVDMGVSWQNIGALYSDINWYNSSSLSGIPGGQQLGWTYSENGWLTAIHSLNDFTDATHIIFRVVFGSDNENQSDGFAFDKFSISDTFCYAGEDMIISTEIENGDSINLNNILISNGIVVNGVNKKWSFISGPNGPRSPWLATVSGEDEEDVDFPNTGSGPPEEYYFELVASDGQCEDSAIIGFTMPGDGSPSNESEVIYICSGELIESADELFNIFNLSQIRFLDDGNWSSETDLVTFPLGSGEYSNHDSTFEIFDEVSNEYISSGNKLNAKVEELDCSDESITFSFANTQNTNDGSYDYYEVDVMIESNNAGSSFKMGDGKLVFSYNEAAFGQYIKAYDNIEITTPVGYITGQAIDADPSQYIYSNFRTLDNRNDPAIRRFSWSFNQSYSSSTFASDNVSNTPSKLCHLKIRYQDVNLNPNLLFEEDGIYDNKFTTATICGFVNGGSEITNCLPELRTLIVNDTFDSFGTTLSDNDVNFSQDISLYPNPTDSMLYIKGNITALNAIRIYSVSGSQIMELNQNLTEIDISRLESGIYFLKLISGEASKTLKFIKK